MKTMEVNWAEFYFGSDRAQAQESEYFCHRGKPARRFSVTYSAVYTDEDIDAIGREIAEWMFDSTYATVSREAFDTYVVDWYDEESVSDNTHYDFCGVLLLARDEIYESYVKWMDALNKEFGTEDDDDDDEEDEDY